MAQSTLVAGLIDDGLELIKRLVPNGFPIIAAWWAKPVEDQEWVFFLVSRLVDELGPGVAYQRAYEALQDSQKFDLVPARITLGITKIIGERSPIAQEIFKIIKLHGGGPPFYVRRCKLGEIEVEDVYIVYVLTLPTPWHPAILMAPAEVDEPLSSQDRAAMIEIGASGTTPVRAGWPKSSIAAGTVVNARVLGSGSDSDPLLLFKLPDGRQGITRKSNTKPL